MLTKSDVAELVRRARFERDVSWGQLAEAIDRPVVWTVAALLGQHPLTADQATTVDGLLGLGPEAVTVLQLQPYRGSGEAVRSDPTVYRLHEAVDVYGPALKELIHEEFGDGIMSAINFTLDLKRRPHEDGDRVVITMDGKFLDYRF